MWQKSAQSTFPRRLAQRSTEKLLAIKIIAAYARSTGATDLKLLKKRKAADLGATRQAAKGPKAPAVRAVFDDFPGQNGRARVVRFDRETGAVIKDR